MSPRAPIVVVGALALVIAAPACNFLKKSEAAGDAGAPAASASIAAAPASTSTDADAAVAAMVDAAPPRHVAPTAAPPPKPDPPVCAQARALRNAGNSAWQVLASKCTEQGGKM